MKVVGLMALELYAIEGGYKDLTLTPTTSSALFEPGAEQKANEHLLVSFSGEYETNEDSPMSTQTHLFSTGDKFVKIRATFGAYTPALTEVSEFAKELAKHMEVPDESLFMARLRKQWRSGTDR